MRISDWSADVCSSDLRKQTLPMLRAQLTDSAGAMIAEWSFDPPRGELDAGASAPFETETRNPPEGAQNLSITFAGSHSPAVPPPRRLTRLPLLILYQHRGSLTSYTYGADDACPH